MKRSLYLLAFAISLCARNAMAYHSSAIPVAVQPLTPLGNFTKYWAYYKKYLRRPISDLIDAMPFTIQTQLGTTIKDVTPQDVRKSISKALDMMPFSNQTAFELELQRLRKEAENNTFPLGNLWIADTTELPITYTGVGPVIVSNNTTNSEPKKSVEKNDNTADEAYSDKSGQPRKYHYCLFIHRFAMVYNQMNSFVISHFR